jgi:dihydrolipoamide dehydrogenase
MKNTHLKFIILLVVAALMGIFFVFDLHQYFTLFELKARQQAFGAFYADNQALTIAIYMTVYIVMAALSLPGAAVMTLAGGALFGVWVGLIAVSFASTIGATLAFIVARFLLKDYVQNKFKDKLKAINDGIQSDGNFYLFTLRLVPIFPFFVINLAMSLTPLRVGAFYLVSQIGMLPGTLVYVNAGTQLSMIDSLQGILSPGLIFSFALLGIFPLLAKKITEFVKARRALSKYSRPKTFDYNLIVIGAGSAGLVTSYIAAVVKSKVALIEKHKMGGDCLNTGCVPSKALIRSAKILSYARRGEEFGLKKTAMDFDFKDVMKRVHDVIHKVEPHDSVERYTSLGIDCIDGEAKIISPYSVEINGRTLTTKSIVIATGARPFVPPIPGLDKISYLTSDNIWNLKTLPKHLVVLGGGPIGSELTQAFARLGSNVTQVEMAPQIMGREDPDVSAIIRKKFEDEGVHVLTAHTAKEIIVDNNTKILVCDHNGQKVNIEFDEILVAVGRAANSKGFGLEELDVQLNPNKTIAVNEFLQTNIPNILAAGDVAGPYQFTHVAAHQAWYAAVNSLFGKFKKFKTDYRVIPWATYTDPEVARVGFNETDAKESGIEYEVTIYGIDDLDRAIADSENHGFVKVLTQPKSDKILGVTIVGPHASDIIAEYVFAMKHGLGLNKILGTIHIYPTLAEANKYAAGEWKKAHAPEGILNWVKKFHKWQRG